MSINDPMLAALPEEVRTTLRSYVTQMDRLFGSTLQAVILYGSAARGEYVPGRSNLNLLLLLTKPEMRLLQQYGKAHRRWHREQIVVPLFLTERDLGLAQQFFPLECAEIQDHHVVLAGGEPLAGFRVDPARLGAQCEQEVQGNLLRLRQRFVEGAGTTEAIAILLPLSLNALLASVRGLLRVLQLPVPRSTDTLLAELPSTVGIEAAALLDVWKLKRGMVSPGPLEFPRLFERYMTSLDSLAERIARLRTEGRVG